VRGILASRELAGHFGLHTFDSSNVGSSFMQWLVWQGTSGVLIGIVAHDTWLNARKARPVTSLAQSWARR